MKIKEIELKQFCGVEKFNLAPMGNNCLVTGQNGTGKTSLKNAYLWCLTGKDENGKELDPSPVDSAGNRIEGKEPYVYLTIITDSGQEVFTRGIREKVSKKKGVPRKQEGVYMLNGVECRQKDFDERVEEVIRCNTEVFRVIVDPDHLVNANKLKSVQARRDALAKVSGEITEPEFEGRPAKESLAIVKAEIKKLKESIETIPARLEEAQEGIPEQVAESKEELMVKIKQLDTEIAGKNKTSNLLEKQSELARLERQAQAEYKEKKDEMYREGTKLDRTLLELKADAERLSREKDGNDRELEALALNQQTLKADYEAVKGKTFDQTKCSFCNQDLPEFLAEEMKAKFNAEMAQRRKDLIDKGTVYKNKIENLNQKNNAIVEKETAIQNQMKEIAESQKTLSGKILGFTYTDTPEIENLRSAVKYGSESDNSEPDSTDKLAEELKELWTKVGRIETRENKEKRIKEILLMEENQNIELSDKEGLKHEIDTIIKGHNEKVEENVNSKFKHIKFKLFDYQKNGELKDVCDATVDGVPYNTTLNTGNKINALIDIANVFSGIAGQPFPVFLDNAEAVTEWKVKSDNQLIKLFAKEGQKQLKMEI
jgi:DNA repair exonuclease SbcCD ATPase subunit